MSRFEPEDRRLLEAAVARLAEDHHAIMRCRSGDMECSADEWSRFAAQGLFGLGISPSHGGVGGGGRELAVVTREIGRNLLGLPFLDCVVLAGALIQRFAGDEQAHARLPRVADGSLRISLAHREAAAGDDRGHVETILRQGRLSGEKVFVLAAAAAAEFIVSARDERGDLRLCFVANDAEGLSRRSYRTADGRLAATLAFRDVEAEPMPCAANLDGAFDLAGACLAAEAVGAMEALHQETLDYAKTRRQFGVPIGSFQVLQHRLVDMLIAIREASALVADALEAIDADAPDAAFLVSAAKARTDTAARFVAESAIQVHGGMGMTDECAAGHYLKRLLVIGSQFGTAEWHVERVARLVA